jgi:phage shock protein PspC (stress-responsive transcriptional regulator)/FtsH-binding integral membrane protein
MRGLGLVRTDGWIGGVCAGVADRLGIDPIIIRGIVVVAAILGAPALLLYAAAWALLPDRQNRIHLQRLLDGDFQPAIVGIGAMALLSLLPMGQGLWWAGQGFWGVSSWGDAVGRVIWTLVVLALVVGLVIAVSRGTWTRNGSPYASPYAGKPAPPTPPAATDAVYVANATGTVPSAAADEEVAADEVAETAENPSEEPLTAPAPTLDTTTEPSEPPAPSAEATTEDLAEWRARHAAWQAEHAQWKQRLNEDMRAVKAQRAAEMRAQSSMMAAEASARRKAFRAANPRAGAAFGWAAVGVALVAAAITQALWQSTELPEYSLTAAFAVATATFGVAVLVAGLARRRSGFLIFLGILLAVVTIATAFIPRDRQVVFDGAYINVDGTTSLAQPYGYTDLAFDQGLTNSRGTPVVDLEKGVGTTTALVPSGMTLKVEAVLHGGSLFVTDDSNGTSFAHTCTPGRTGACTIEVTVGPDGTDATSNGSPDAILRVEQTGEMSVNIQDQGDGQ